MNLFSILADVFSHLSRFITSPFKEWQNATFKSLVFNLFWYAFLVVCLFAESLVRNFYVAREHPQLAARFLWRKITRGSPSVDFSLWTIAFVLLVIFHLVMKAKRKEKWTTSFLLQRFYSSSFLLLPVILMSLSSLFLTEVWKNAWWWAQHALNSKAVFLWQTDGSGEVSWLRFFVKFLVSYGLSLFLFLLALRQDFHMCRCEKEVLEKEELNIGTEKNLQFSRYVFDEVQKKSIWGTGLALFLVLMGASTMVFSLAKEDVNLRPLQVGDEVLDVVLPWVVKPKKQKTLGSSLSNTMFRIRDYRGKVLVLDFWASWCRPCMKSVPLLNDLAEEMGDELVVIGINREPRQQKKTAEIMAKQGFAFSSAVDHRAGTAKGFGEQIGLQTLPTTLLISKEGKVRALHLGLKGFASLKKEVKQELAR